MLRFFRIALLCLVAALAPAWAALQTDIVYGIVADADLKLDLAQPDGPGPFPTVICIHGGAWMSGSKSGWTPVMLLLNQNGYAAAAVDYRFAPAHQYPAQIDDVRLAVRYLRAHAAELKIDPTRLAVAGDSAGGHLALMVGLQNPEEGVRGIIDLYGPSDMTRWQATPDGEKALGMDSGKLLEMVFGTQDRTSTALKNASPLFFVASGRPPVLTLHGDSDPIVKIEQSEWLHDALRKAGVPEKLVVVKGASHGFQGADLQIAIGAVLEFLSVHVK
jgi:acetyl esterase/lipase